MHSQHDELVLQNDTYRITVDPATGAISSFVIEGLGDNLIGEKRLLANFRLCLPLPGCLCNYIEGMAQSPVTVAKEGDAVTVIFSGMNSPQGCYPIDLAYTVVLDGDQVRFQARLTNATEYPVSEFWFPRLGGWTRFGAGREALLAVPNYRSCGHNLSLFKQFPGRRSLGGEAAEFSTDYPGMSMPWWDLYDKPTDLGLYLGYHDETFRYSTWLAQLVPNITGRNWDAWLTPEEAQNAPIGLIFSHVRYPFIHSGETFDTGEFVIRAHKGDWHDGSQFYRCWFLSHWPLDTSTSWLRKESAWFAAQTYQAEDRIVTDYEGFSRWCREAQEFGVNCFELQGWDKGGIERDYPEYVPEEKLGGRVAFRRMLEAIHAENGRCLPFVNYNVLDTASDWYEKELHQYAHQDQFGQTPNWMGWGYSTLMARKKLDVRRHVLSSVIPTVEQILERCFVALAEDGADGLQIDKLCVGSLLDFNPLNTQKPDVAMCEGLVRSVGRVLARCRQVNPDFRFAAEAGQDRYLPYVDVFYRTSVGRDVSPLRYVFPEWTSCQHVNAPYDFGLVNLAVLTGSVICVEPETYQASLADPLWREMARYIQEVERIRRELKEIIFLGLYRDTLGATVTEMVSKPPAVEGIGASVAWGEIIAPAGQGVVGPAKGGALHFAVHKHSQTGQRAIVVANTSKETRCYHWQFLGANVPSASLYEPYRTVRSVGDGEILEIRGEGLHILVE